MEAIPVNGPVKRSRYFLAASVLALVFALVGFLKTFIIPKLSGTFEAPAVIYVHGGFLFLWTVFFVVQAVLIRRKKLKYHRLLGFGSVVLVLGVAISTMAAGVYVMKRDLALGLGEIATSALLGTFTTPLIFMSFVAAGIYYRRKPEIHKRLMLLAMIAIMWPAFFRFRHYFPGISNPELIFGVLLPNSMTLLVMLWEKLTMGTINRVYLYAGTALFAENLAENYFFDSPGWRIAAHWLAGFFL
ncbi:MAG: hypothetical protein QM785_15780 [Pyrinomonadaceae bacterium]